MNKAVNDFLVRIHENMCVEVNAWTRADKLHFTNLMLFTVLFNYTSRRDSPLSRLCNTLKIIIFVMIMVSKDYYKN